MGTMERTEEVQELQEIGASVLCLGCPQGLYFGIDYSYWQVGPQFMGIKLIPPGSHYIYCGLGDGENVLRTGFFTHLNPKEVLVRKWCEETETLEPVDGETASRYAEGVRNYDFDSNLGPYPQEWMTKWADMSRHISRELIDKIEPVGKVVKNASKKMEENEAEGVEGSYEGAAPKLFFSEIPRNPTFSTGAEITHAALDKSAVLEAMIEKHYKGKEVEILGELQFAYIAFLMGQNYQGFEQWKKLVLLLSSCEDAAEKKADLMCAFVRTLYCQLQQFPEDMFSDELLANNFLAQSLSGFFEICADPSISAKLQSRATHLRELVKKRFGIDPMDVEDGPMIVDAEEVSRALDS